MVYIVCYVTQPWVFDRQIFQLQSTITEKNNYVDFLILKGGAFEEVFMEHEWCRSDDKIYEGYRVNRSICDEKLRARASCHN